MIVFRVAVVVRDDRLAEARVMFAELSRVSRSVPGVVDFDILQDPDRPTRFVSIEVYQDQQALDRQGELPELAQVMAAFPRLLADGPHGTKFHVSTADPWPAEPASGGAQ